ncbi:MAG: UDP-2,3-diacylglucosamine diphosphatase, partial [Pseudomonadota bacterium]
MAGVTLFVSDLHLSGERPDITALFIDFLGREAAQADALYMLGDIFEYWIGDEAVNWPEYRPVIAALSALTRVGVPFYLMHGNRDFLMGAGLEKATGGKLLDDPTHVSLYGTDTLLMHGDSLCTRDTEYMQFRTMVRDPKWQKEFLARSVAERDAIARNYRELSKANGKMKPMDIMDVTPEAVEETLRAQQVRRLIHGHTHRPATHTLT